ncbi:unnamed protein product [Gulo gulo]|uniref:Rab-GAP TBC domain-containing protein n=1 Tax=Gulo gulo TaxID=48420 RepID=A0A9X9LNE4_GULGU|nr:unnamed protein product [Gulo gulo]
MEGAGYRVVFEKGGVYLHTSAKKHQDPDSLIAGVIRVVEKDSDVLLHWVPVEEAGDSTQILFSKKDVSAGDSCTSEEEPTFDPGYEPDWAVISTVRPQSRHLEPTRGAEPSSPRGSWAFSVSLGELKSIRRSKPGLSWAYLVLVTQAGGSLPALHFHRGGTRALLRVLSRYLLLASSPQDPRLYLVFPHDSSALSSSFHHLQLFDQDSSNVVSRFLQDPYSTTFSSFSRVTNFFRGALQPHPEGASPDLLPPPDDEPEPGFEVISCVELGPRPAVERAPPLTEEEWAHHVGPEGRLQQVPLLKARIFSGGLSPGLRREAWKFLLGYLSWEGSAEEHKAHVRKKTDEYFRMKLQWKSVSPEQERRNSLLHGYRSLIERDVSRTDRTNKFYEGPENPGLGLLNDILLTYCMYHFDLGYVQGMSDLLSPILYVIQNEVDAFWCFCGFMELVHGNFEESQETMKRQLGQLLLLLRVLDPQLCDFLGECLWAGEGGGGPDPPFLRALPPHPPRLWKWPRTGSRTFGPDPDKGNIPAKARTQNSHVKAGSWFGAILSKTLPHERAPSGSLQSRAWQMGLGPRRGHFRGCLDTSHPTVQRSVSELCTRTDLTCPAGHCGYLQFCIMRSIIWIVPLG